MFVSTHRFGSKWKEEFRVAPFWVKKVMENGEKGVKVKWLDEGMYIGEEEGGAERGGLSHHTPYSIVASFDQYL